MTKVYLATPVGDPTETLIRSNAAAAEEILVEKGFEVYCPWKIHVPHAWDYPNPEWGLMVFMADMVHLEEAEIVVVLSYGRVGTCGTAWEQGYAYAKDKKVIVVEMNEEIQSIMVANGRYATVKGIVGLSEYDFNEMPKTRTETEQK